MRSRYDSYIMMYRTQINLPGEDHRRAKTRAAELGISLAEYVRRLIRRDLDEGLPRSDISAIFDLFASDETMDIARLDEQIGEAVEAEHMAEVHGIDIRPA